MPARRSIGGRTPNIYRELSSTSCSTQALIDIVVNVGERAQITARITPHSLRHAFGDHVARQAGLRAAQEVLGHADVGTTQSTYVGRVTLDELTAAVGDFRWRDDDNRARNVSGTPDEGLEATRPRALLGGVKIAAEAALA